MIGKLMNWLSSNNEKRPRWTGHSWKYELPKKSKLPAVVLPSRDGKVEKS